jgi:hypothetical protein
MSLSGPSRTIRVEPLEVPVTAPPPREQPAPEPPPAAPDRQPVPAGA